MNNEPNELDQDEPYLEVITTEVFVERIEEESNQQAEE